MSKIWNWTLAKILARLSEVPDWPDKDEELSHIFLFRLQAKSWTNARGYQKATVKRVTVFLFLQNPDR